MFQTLLRALTQSNQGTARRAAPAFLRGADQHINTTGFHIDPDCTRGNAVQHKEAINRAHRFTHRTEVRLGQHDACRCFNVGRKNHCRLFTKDGRNHLFDRGGCKGCLRLCRHRASLQHRHIMRDLAGLEDLRPAIAEPAIAQNETRLVLRKLTGHGFHTVGATARNNHGGIRLIHLFDHRRDVGNDLLELLRHVVERAVGIHDRKLEQAIRVYSGQQSGHGALLVMRQLR